MATFEQIASSVCDGIERLVDRLEPFWREDPWRDLAIEDRTNALPGLIRHACALALEVRTESDPCERMLQSAALHGYTRRRQRLPESVLLRELAVIRQAIWSDLQTRYRGEDALVTEVILRIDRVFSLASQATLRGYFRTEFESLEAWPQVITDLERDWIAPIPPERIFGRRHERRFNAGRSAQIRIFRRPRRDRADPVIPHPPTSMS